MTKRIFALCLVGLLLLTSAFCFAMADEDHVFDKYNLLSDNEEQLLNVKIAQLKKEYDLDAAIVTLSYGSDSDNASLAQEYFDKNNIGVGKQKNGVLLLINMADRSYYVDGHGSMGNQVEKHFDDSTFVSYLSKGDYYKAATAFLNEAARRAAEVPEVYKEGTGSGYAVARVKELLPWAAIGGTVIAVITVLILRGKMKTARGKNNATDYAVKDSFKLNKALDLYLYTTHTRTKIETNNGSHGGGGGGGSHSGHGGHF